MGDGLNKQERRMLRRQRKVDDRRDDRESAERRSSNKNKLYIGIGILVLGVIIIGFSAFPSTGNIVADGVAVSDLTGIPNSFVHWHADLDVTICGVEQVLPESRPGGMIGTGNMHTHDKAANLRSQAGSNGNGVVHNEGVLLNQPQEQTIGKFTDLMNIQFSKTRILDKNNGDACPDGKQGTVKFFVNDEENDQWRNYIPRDNDFIRIEFS